MVATTDPYQGAWAGIVLAVAAFVFEVHVQREPERHRAVTDANPGH